MSAATLNMTVASGAIVAAGKLAKDEKLEFKMLAAAGITALGLSLLENVDERLAKLFAGSILLTAAFYYVPAITEKMGYTGGSNGHDAAGKKSNLFITKKAG